MSKNTTTIKTAEQMDAERREMKARQSANAHAHSMALRQNEDGPEHEEFDYCFTGKFSTSTQERFAEIQAEEGGRLITTGLVYQLVALDQNIVRVVLDGPVEQMKGKEIVVRPYGFRTIEQVHVKDEATGEFIPQLRDGRTEMKIRSVVVALGGGFAMRFKYNSFQKRIVVC